MRGGTDRAAAAFRGAHAPRVCCARCGHTLAHLRKTPRIDVYDAEGIVVERETAALHYQPVLDPDWQRAFTGLWQYPKVSIVSRNSHSQAVAAIVRNMRRAGVSETLGLVLKRVTSLMSRDIQSVDAVCPQCSSMNRISLIRRPE